MSRHSPMSRLVTLAAVCGASGLLGACVATSPQWDSQFGDATRRLAAQQRLDPDAARRNAERVPPADGRSVRAARDGAEASQAPAPTRGAASMLSVGEDR